MDYKNNLEHGDLDILIVPKKELIPLSNTACANVNTNNSSVANINEVLIEMMASFNPDELGEEYFVQATLSLDGHDFARAVYRTYLKREPEDPYLRVDGVLSRTAFVNLVKTCREYQNRSSFPTRKTLFSCLIRPIYTLLTKLLIESLALLNPNKFSNELFVRLTYILNRRDFGRAVYRTYLKREPDTDVGVKRNSVNRIVFLGRVRKSPEYMNLWFSGLKK